MKPDGESHYAGWRQQLGGRLELEAPASVFEKAKKGFFNELPYHPRF